MTHPLARRILLATAVAALALGQTACITRNVREEFYDDGYTTGVLRSQVRGTTTVPQGFDHPAVIAKTRMAHILSRIDLRETGDEAQRRPAIPLEMLFIVADALSQGLAQADADQEVAIQAIRRRKKWGVFDHKHLTSLLAYVRNDLLYIHISRSDWEYPERRAERLPETYVGEYPMDFRLIVDRGMTLVDPQAVAVQWRDDVFKRPTRTRVTASGRVVRREVLMESFEEDLPDQPVVSPELSSAQLRALADLEDARRAGEVSEAEYAAERARILRGDAP